MNAIHILAVLFGTFTIVCGSFPNVHSDPTSSLLTTLQHFNGPRNDKFNETLKNKARTFIQKSFEEAGLQTWRENITIGGVLPGVNIVGIFRGENTGTAKDKIVIVVAHYDTTETTTGLDDNGSGVTAMLETAKQIGKAKLSHKNTIMFVAVDFEEWTVECNITWPISCGSKEFVKNLTSYLKQTNGTVNGALILETIINHNTTADSQELPPGVEQALPSAYEEVKNNLFRGDFLAVIGRAEGDKRLLSLMDKYYEKDGDYRAQLMPLPLTKKPSEDPRFDAFYRSDHISFWEEDDSALFITDTADHRSYMQKCYHNLCDNLDFVKEDDLEFLRRTINAVIQTTLELSEAESTPTSKADGMKAFNFLFPIALIFNFIYLK